MFKPVPNGLVLFLTGLNIDNFRTFVNVQRDHKMNIPRTFGWTYTFSYGFEHRTFHMFWDIKNVRTSGT